MWGAGSGYRLRAGGSRCTVGIVSTARRSPSRSGPAVGQRFHQPGHRVLGRGDVHPQAAGVRCRCGDGADACDARHPQQIRRDRSESWRGCRRAARREGHGVHAPCLELGSATRPPRPRAAGESRRPPRRRRRAPQRGAPRAARRAPWRPAARARATRRRRRRAPAAARRPNPLRENLWQRHRREARIAPGRGQSRSNRREARRAKGPGVRSGRDERCPGSFDSVCARKRHPAVGAGAQLGQRSGERPGSAGGPMAIVGTTRGSAP